MDGLGLPANPYLRGHRLSIWMSSKSSQDRVREWFIVAVVLLLLIPAIWAIAPPSREKDIIVCIMSIADLVFWACPVLVFVKWVRGWFSI